MARKSVSTLDFDEAHGEAFYGRPIYVRSVSPSGKGLKLYNLKHRHPEAYHNDICEIELEGVRIKVRNQDLIQALGLM